MTVAALVVVLGLLAVDFLHPGDASALTWQAQTSGTTQTLKGVACPTTNHCWAVGGGGTIRSTTTGGSLWSGQTSGVSNPLADVSCPTTSNCWATVEALAPSVRMIATTTGGSSWGTQSVPATDPYYAISCPTASTCWAMGGSGVIATTTSGLAWTTQYGAGYWDGDISCPTTTHCWMGGRWAGPFTATTDGGFSWGSQSIPDDSDPSNDDESYHGLSCPTTTHCWAVGYQRIIATANGGSSWTLQSSSGGFPLWEVSCPTTTYCWAVGASGRIMATTDGGSTWNQQSSGTTNSLYGISCVPGTTKCWAVGGSGKILTTTDVEPQTTIVDPKPSNPSPSSAADFDYTSDKPGATFVCELDGVVTTPSPCADSGQSYTGLSEGSHTFRVWAVDPSGYADLTPASYTWTVDTVSPETTIRDPKPEDPTNETSANFEYESTEPGSQFVCELDGGVTPPCLASGKTYTGLDDGEHIFRVWAIDQAGNVDSSPATYTWTVDTTAPETTIADPKPPNPSNSSSADFHYSANESNVSFTCELDGVQDPECPASGPSYSGLPDGPHTFRVWATDEAGNIEARGASYTWTVDTAAPDTTLRDPKPNNPTPVREANFTYTSEPGATFVCKLDGVETPPCPPFGKSYAALADGSHTFQVWAVDAAGNGDPTPPSYTWTVDTVPPETTITSGPDADSISEVPEVHFTYGSEPEATFECQLERSEDGAPETWLTVQPFSSCPGSGWSDTLEDGRYRFSVRAIDRARNIDSSPDTRIWRVRAPSAKCDSPTATAYDGYAGTTYVRLRVQQGTDANPEATVICVRADNRQGLVFGGAFIISQPGADAPAPAVDDHPERCTSEPSNLAPGPHPLLDGSTGDPAEPLTYLPFRLDSYANADRAWICVDIGGAQPLRRRIVVETPQADVQLPVFRPDPATVKTPAPEAAQAGNPSSTCESAPGGERNQIANADTQDGHVYLYERRTANTAQICLRLWGDLVKAGGLLQVDASGPIGSPVVEPGSDLGPCGFSVLGFGQPLDLELRRSATGFNPASICVRYGQELHRLTIGTDGSPIPQWSFIPDPVPPSAVP